jgi:hypothetical protein
VSKYWLAISSNCSKVKGMAQHGRERTRRTQRASSPGGFIDAVSGNPLREWNGAGALNAKTADN